jgi:antitoxin CcdA
MNDASPSSIRRSHSRRRPTNVSLSAEIVAEARELDINLSQACERGLVETIAEARKARWLEENREALESSNAWVEANGLPLAKYRLF